MKIRVTILTENDKKILPDVKREDIIMATKSLWDCFLNLSATDGETATVENVEIVDE